MENSFASKLKASLKNVFGVVAQGRTYSNLLYLVLAFPLGLAYFIFLAVGISLGIGLFILIIGLPLLLLTLLIWRQMVKLEQLQSRGLLGAEITPEPLVRWAEKENTWLWLRSRLSSPVTWKGLGYLFLKFPLGLLAFVLLIVLGAFTLSLIAMPFIYQHVNIDIGGDVALNLIEALGLMVMGLFLGLFSLHIWNGLAWVFKWLSEKLLGTSPKVVCAE
jgi:hypothetical protein